MSIKILVGLNEAFLALQGHLEEMPSSVRSERLRALASIGLQIQSGKLQAAVSVPESGGGRGQAKTDFLQFPVVLNEAYPDLLCVLRDTPPRLRAERIRGLALLGLHAVSGGPLSLQAPLSTVRPGAPPVVKDFYVPTNTLAPDVPAAAVAENAPHQDAKEMLAPPPSGPPSISAKVNSRVSRLARSLGT